jgi:hypothetical protein
MPTTRFAAVLAVAAILVVAAGPAEAQVVEVSPAVGYRVGFSSLSYLSGTTSDVGGGISYAVTVDVKYARDRAVEGLFSRQVADIVVTDVYGSPARLRVTVDYWHGGGIQEFGDGRVRPFLAGTLGLTRYWEAGFSAYRFSVGAGGGVKLWATRNFGAKLDGRIFATIVNGNQSIGICGGAGCLVHVNVGGVWQADFNAAVLIAF